jgi:biotin operon repressor
VNDRLVWRVAVRDSELDATAKHVALTLDTYMDRRGIAWPSKPTLARDTGYTVRAVDRAINRLEQAGLLVVARSRGRRSNLYSAALNPVPSDGVEGTPTPYQEAPTPYQETPNPVPGATGSRKKPLSRSRTPVRTREQNNTETVDPIVMDLINGWLNNHKMQ